MSEQPQSLAAVFDEHMAAEFVGRDDVADCYREHFIGHWPADLEVTPISRTIGADQVVDEIIVSFTHDIEMDTYCVASRPPAGASNCPMSSS